MGMTMTQKILAAHAGLDCVKAGDLIEADLDLVLGNDITSPVAIHEMEKFNAKQVFNKDKIALVPDHFVPNKDIKSAEHCKIVRDFADGYRACPSSGKRTCSGGRCGYRSRFTHMYVWSPGCVFYRNRFYGHGSRNGYG